MTILDLQRSLKPVQIEDQHLRKWVETVTRILTDVFSADRIPKLDQLGEVHTDISITAGNEQATAHTLGVAPDYIIITKRQGGDVHDGPTAHTASNFYLKNWGTTDATVSVILFTATS